MDSVKSPNIKWAERKDKLFVTIELNDVKDPKIELTDDNRLVFTGAADNKTYKLDLELFGECSKEESKWTLNTRNIFLKIQKKTSGPYWSYLNKDKKKYNFIHVDWNLYIEEDEEDEQQGGMDGGFPGMMGGNNFMDMMGGGMGGMGDMGMDMDPNDLDEDDLPNEGEKDNKDLDDLDKPSEV